jgi:hypothetical protein
MKFSKIFLSLIFLLSINSYADQLSYITKDQAAKAVEYLKTQKEVLLSCTCCEEPDNEYIKITNVYYKHSGSEDFYLVIIEGKNSRNQIVERAVDLAYVFIGKQGNAYNLASELNLEYQPCPLKTRWNPNLNFSKEKIDGQNYFKEIFINQNTDTYTLFALHQPSLKDCMAIFKQEFALLYFVSMNMKFCEMANEMLSGEMATENMFAEYRYCFLEEFNTNDIIKKDCPNCVGALFELSETINPNITLYNVVFTKQQNDANGFNISFVTYIDDRWVLFPVN